MNTALHISAVATAIGADCVLLIDSLQGFHKELCSTIHINNTGLSGVDSQAVGIPVFLLGIPTSYSPDGNSKSNISDKKTFIGIDKIIQKAALIFGYALMHKFYPSVDEGICTLASLAQQDQF